MNNQFTGSAVVQASQIVDHYPRTVNNCPLPSRIFQGRQEILKEMQKYFKQDLGTQHIYVLYGLGGAGKTQIGLKFIEESSHFVDKVLVDASTPETIDMGFKGIATAKKIGDSPQDALRWLASNHNEWLLFFDNADDPKMNLNKFLPKCKHGNIVVTSRNPGLRVYGASSQVTDMEEADAVVLLLRSAALGLSETNQLVAAEIVKVLCYLPLAIIQAGAFISESGALNTYLELYKENRTILLSDKPAQMHDDYAWTVYTTWQMSFNKLSPAAAKLLQLCSFLHWDGIFEEIFSRAAAVISNPTEEFQEPIELLSQFLNPTGKWDSLRFIKIMNEIKAYSLINFDPESKNYSIHPLVHSWCQTLATDQKSYHSCISALLAMSLDGIAQEDKELASLRLVSHVNSSMLVGSRFAAHFGSVYYYARQYQEAENIQLRIVDEQRNLFGDDHESTLHAIENLARTYWASSQYKTAQNLQILVLENRRRLLGYDHLDTILAMQFLGRTYRSLGQFQKAEELLVSVLEKQRIFLGDNHLHTLHTMHSLAMTYSDLDRHEEARKLEVELVEKRRKLLGDDHLHTLSGMHNLAWTYYCLGQLAKSEELEVVALEKRSKLLGDCHKDTLDCMHNLAIIYNDLDRHEEARRLQVEVVEKRRELLGDDHLTTLWGMNNLAGTYYHLGQLAKAEELQVVVLEKRRKLLGNCHKDTQWAAENLAETFRHLDKFPEAEELEKFIKDNQNKSAGSDNQVPEQP
ncbi:P-loop containing nucleoside triphosphate hydrolase protein [Mycena metata]|uniref:P-loop containing nucleoside triphosphate hydrolase protein n=1 Tax=Mycena metata TaxID=1033252 RepID=A0AAD7HH65_9AGAR|nr:P-loop containing nucleoside triphosphate hydrolase protein [Mycena metata]